MPKHNEPDDMDRRRHPLVGGAFTSFLVEETTSMARKQRELEQQGNRKLTKVHTKERFDPEQSTSPEGELQQHLKSHPYLERMNGMADPTVSPNPTDNSESSRKFSNEKNEQERQKQLRKELSLGKAPTYSTAPKPRGP